MTRCSDLKCELTKQWNGPTYPGWPNLGGQVFATRELSHQQVVLLTRHLVTSRSNYAALAENPNWNWTCGMRDHDSPRHRNRLLSWRSTVKLKFQYFKSFLRFSFVFFIFLFYFKLCSKLYNQTVFIFSGTCF